MRKAKIVTTGFFAAAMIIAPSTIAHADDSAVVAEVANPAPEVTQVAAKISQQAQNASVKAAQKASFKKASHRAEKNRAKAVEVVKQQKRAEAARKAAAKARKRAKAVSYSNSPSGWINQCIKVTGVPQSWYTGLYTIANRESSFNPRAENGWDSNAAQGYDMRSKGLMQTIGPTFRAYHQPGTSNSIYDPVANCAAAVNYIKATYGDISNVQQANPNLPPKGY